MIVGFTGPRDLLLTEKILTDGLRFAMSVLGVENEKFTGVHVGDAKGVDECVRIYFKELSGRLNRPELDPRIFVANWTKYGRAAGPIRNKEMLRDTDILVAVRDGRDTRGTYDCIREASFQKKGIAQINVSSFPVLTGLYIADARWGIHAERLRAL